MLLGIVSGNSNVNAQFQTEMSIFLLKAKYGNGYSAPVSNITFSDTGTHLARYWIEKLKTDGISYGCGNNNYYPESLVRRDEMAIFLVNTFGLK